MKINTQSPPWTKDPKVKCAMIRVKEYMKTDFLTVTFSGECNIILDGPCDWVKFGSLLETINPHDVESNRKGIK